MPASQRLDTSSTQPALGDVESVEWLSSACGAPLPRADFIPGHELVSVMAAANADAIAVRFAEHETSYGELIAWARCISVRLNDAGVGSGARVALLAEPSAAMVAAVLGILGSGAAYVPIDPAQPDARVASIVADAQVAAMVVTEQTAARAKDLGVPVVQLTDTPEREPDGTGRVTEFPATVSPDDLAYMIYTSGSTGEPKGVLVEHRNLVASMHARHLVYPGSSVFLLVSPLAFDSSVAGFWGTLEAGGCLVVATADEVRDPEQLVRLIGRHGVSRLLCIPSLYNVILDAAERLGADLSASLRLVIVAGEALFERLVERHFAMYAEAVGLVNEYGPTEATVWASYHQFTAGDPVSIGKPIPGARLYALDEEMRPVPRGTEGELYIGGATVARGYFGRPDATAAVFLDDPFASQPGERMYRTGDRVRWNVSGNLEFIGRRDDQVKIRGHRVGLGAVESTLLRLTGVADAAVLPDSAGSSLIGYVASPSDLDPAMLRRLVAERLPPVMVPSEIRVLRALPRNLNGKIDRATLRSDTGWTPPRPVTAPDAGALTTQVSNAWAEVLGLAEVPHDVNFFDLGGHSLTMFKLQDALEKHCGFRVSIVSLFQESTVTSQAALIRREREQGGDTASSGSAHAARLARVARLRQQRARKGAAQ